MTVDLIARAEARIFSLTSQVVALDAQAMDIRDRALDCRLGIQELQQFITLARELADEPEQEPRLNATDGQAAEYAVVTPAAADRVTAEDGHASSAPVSPEGASEEVGGVASACSASAAGSEIPERRELDVDADATGVPAGETAGPSEQSDSHPAAPEEPPALSKRQQVRITHEDHPDWSGAQIAEHLGLSKGSVSGHASSLGIKFSAGAAAVSASSSITKLDRVRLMHEQHPTWTARMIALQLGEKEGTVSTLLATVRKEVRAPAEPKPEFSSEQEMRQHYGDVAARLGKAK
ncbi:hypothetical protein [Devosia sp. Root105]|uniref:hypothetical protein n=1 Tax=Devosia sp. Root105 TaxID=1736423 RepID=UPI000701F872|nr:hypothetical protein [Devosia sp. Root105]KQU96463.1 hypothetical protein ASC68_13880 [Devosia sp. Root105]